MSHTPKWRALIALDADALSPEGEARLCRHLEDCEVCARALAEIQAFEAVTEEVRDSQVDVDWSRMDLALRREARALARAPEPRERPMWLAPAIGLVLAAVVLLALLWNVDDAPVAELDEVPPPAPVVEETPPAPVVETIDGRVVALAGTPTRNGALLALGDAIHEGDTLEVVAEHAVHTAFGPNTAVALIGAARLTASTLHPDEIALELESGEVSSVVERGQAFTIVAAPYEVHALGTRFRVAKSEDGVVTVTLEEGSVEVTRDGVRVARLDAPARWSSHPDLRAASEADVLTPSLGDRTLALELPSSQRFMRWTIDGDALPGGVAGRLLLSAGEHEVVGFDLEGEPHTTTLTLVDEGASLDERTLRPIRTGPVVGYLEPAQIQATVAPTIRRLRACYERDLRRTDPNLSGNITLRVRVARDGTVRRAVLRGEADVPPTLRSCLIRHASAWVFPEPDGGPVTFDLPLQLSTR
ncbi:MAG: AgmX/PglI C-terminal domain-containing protein [Deltaproteobacteria bacterium]|nr:AgmX/PglI C-terminal domain-containing protein [Deltaproteobacteria bacterium]